ncbi:malate synthase A [Vibrio nigripulchritudo SOn1]|uniref:malate synthase n=1 Tax=Vibrio nigripulchritudo SOn1 TaxID=1238450 RepID=A0AAV2VYN4_9VIBR|nr:malate synthase A [Vibrio nigripulchritudo]CCO49707.1 malate synthase A [Vibrio nigripulchritudo SOn1]
MERNPQAKLNVVGDLSQSGYTDIFSPSARAFLESLASAFEPRRRQLIKAREQRQARYDDGELPGYRHDTKKIRDNKGWQVAEIPLSLQDRRVEITGPVDRKMVINALNSGAKVFMCCFEDATSPTWDNMIQGQINLRDANDGSIAFEDTVKNKCYQLNDSPAQLMARPRGIHLPERGIELNGEPIGGCLMDFALYFFHNVDSRKAKGEGVYYYIPKLESMEEAQWWDDVFSYTEHYFAAKTGTIKATVLIETLPAVFQMEEILYAMRNHIVAMNCGRWDYIFSYIKTLKNHGDRILPDRHSVGMDKPFLEAYSKLLIHTCHQRGALAMGGMSAFIPAKDPIEMQTVTSKVIEDKSREANNGHDGTWVAHPALVSIAMDVFNERLKGKTNQLKVMPDVDHISEATLLEPSEGPRNEEGVRKNIRIALYYMEAWIRGEGCVPIYGLMEDAATAEISRASIWQWIHHGVTLNDGTIFTKSVFKDWLQQEIKTIESEIGSDAFHQRRFLETADLFYQISTDKQFVSFLTLPSYPLL